MRRENTMQGEGYISQVWIIAQSVFARRSRNPQDLAVKCKSDVETLATGATHIDTFIVDVPTSRHHVLAMATNGRLSGGPRAG